MKVLMFGWEYPPHILGGLGTASYGITKGLAAQGDVEITFCLPKPWGDEDRSFLARTARRKHHRRRTHRVVAPEAYTRRCRG